MDESELALECKPDVDDHSDAESDTPEFGVFNDELHYVCHESISFPPTLVEQFAAFVTKLDVSSNRFDSVDFLGHFSNLQTAVLDRNRISDTTVWPKLAKLTDLSLNYNFVRDSDLFLNRIETAAPQLNFLSLLGNPACPFLIGAEDVESDYIRYRIYVAYRLPKLRFLDVAPLSEAERQEARRRGMYLKTVRKSDDSVASNTNTNTNVEGDFDDPKYTPLPTETSETLAVKHQSVFGRCKYVYQGKQSEGNRFIMNADL